MRPSSHLNQDALELASEGVGAGDVCPRYERPHDAHHVPEGRVEHEPVDGLAKGPRVAEREDDEKASRQGHGRADPLDDADGIEMPLFAIRQHIFLFSFSPGLVKMAQRSCCLAKGLLRKSWIR